MNLRVASPELMYQYGKNPRISFEIVTESKIAETQYLEIKDLDLLDLTAKKHRAKRSLDANAYMWLLLGKLSEKLNIPAREIYREYIRDIGGNHDIVPIRNDVLKRWIENWASNGIGWICEELRDSTISGYTTVICYAGSSTYDTQQMSRLIRFVVDDCRENGIETKTPKELGALLESWGGRKNDGDKVDKVSNKPV